MLALPAALLLLVLAYRWVIRSDVAFEEASAAAAEKGGGRCGGRCVAGDASGPDRGPRPSRWRSSGPVEVALLWKNLIMMSRYASMLTLLRVLPAIVVIGVILALAGGSSGFAVGGGDGRALDRPASPSCSARRWSPATCVVTSRTWP